MLSVHQVPAGWHPVWAVGLRGRHYHPVPRMKKNEVQRDEASRPGHLTSLGLSFLHELLSWQDNEIHSCS